MSTSQTYSLPPRGIPVHVNSSDRFTGTPSNFRCPQLSNIEQSERSFGLIVKQVIVENLAPVITADVNDLLQYNIDDQNFDLLLTPGQYTILTMIEALQTAFQAIDSGFQVQYNESSYKINVVVPSGHTFRITKSTSTRHKLLLKKLGWMKNEGQTYTNETMIGGDLAKVSGPSLFQLVVNTDINVISTSPQSLQILAAIPVEYGRGSLISYSPAVPNMFKIRASDIENMTFLLCDEENYILDLPEHTLVHYHFTLVPLAA